MAHVLLGLPTVPMVQHVDLRLLKKFLRFIGVWEHSIMT